MKRFKIRPPQKLFVLLRHLEIDQNTLAQKLGVSHTLVSLWANGKKPIPTKHRQSIQDIVYEKCEQKIEDHNHEFDHIIETIDTKTKELETIDSDLCWKNFQERNCHIDELNLQLDAVIASMDTTCKLLKEWNLEDALLSGDLYHDLFAYCRTLGQFGAQQKQPLTPEQRVIMQEAQEGIRVRLLALEALEIDKTDITAVIAEKERLFKQEWRKVSGE